MKIFKFRRVLTNTEAILPPVVLIEHILAKGSNMFWNGSSNSKQWIKDLISNNNYTDNVYSKVHDPLFLLRTQLIFYVNIIQSWEDLPTCWYIRQCRPSCQCNYIQLRASVNLATSSYLLIKVSLCFSINHCRIFFILIFGIVFCFVFVLSWTRAFEKLSFVVDVYHENEKKISISFW